MKITEYDKVDTLQNSDVLLLSGDNGVKIISFENILGMLNLLPESTMSDVGKFLIVNSSGKAHWETVLSAESEAY